MQKVLKKRKRANSNLSVSISVVEQRIHIVRGKRVMFDSDLATIYQVETRAINQAVRRNLERFPEDFCFQLTSKEFGALRSQIVTLKAGRGKHRKFLPLVFTEHGVTMLASVLKSQRAIEASIAIVRTFVRLRELLVTHADLARRVDDLEKHYDESFAAVFVAIRRLMDTGRSKKHRIGFNTEDK